MTAPSATVEFRQLLDRLSACCEVRTRTLLGVDGAGGAGKSTLAATLMHHFEAVSLVEMDDFYRPMDEHARASLSPEEGADLYFDWQRLRREVLIPLAAGRIARYRRFDWEAQEVASPICSVDAEGLVIVEGVYALRRELRTFYDLTVYVSTPAAIRRDRQVARGQNDPEWIARWMAAERSYQRDHQPKRAATLIVRGI